MKEYTFIDLFAGIGGIRTAFERAGCKCVFSSEIDEYAVKTYKKNFGDTPHGDITKIPSSEIPPHDILAAGWPCPSFSIIGNGKGLHDARGALFFEIERILMDKKPSAFLLENVKNLRSIAGGKIFALILDRLESAGYFVHWKVLNALNFGLPQKRERTIIVGFNKNYDFEIPESNGKSWNLEDILESPEKIDKKYLASERIRKSRLIKVEGKKVFRPSVWHENKGGNVSVLPFSCALRHSGSYNYLLVNGERLPTPRELLRLQGFPENFEVVGPYTRIRNQVGNSVPVPAIEAVAKAMIETMNGGKLLPTQTYIRASEKVVT